MRKASEYRQHADECRHLAATMGDEHRDQLLAMAETWDALADDREKMAAKTGDEAKSSNSKA